jgi:ABC-type oligopeptide transport system substrate-binding subunit
LKSATGIPVVTSLPSPDASACAVEAIAAARIFGCWRISRLGGDAVPTDRADALAPSGGSANAIALPSGSVAGANRKVPVCISPAAAYFTAVGKPGDSPEILRSGWAADYTAASNFIKPLFSCGTAGNYTHFCDRELDRRIVRALKLQQIDLTGANRLWAELDREITDRALWIPLYSVYGADLVSKRVRNYQYNPVYGALLSQLWVR